MNNKIPCNVCEYAKQNKKASVYSNKHCSKCDSHETCEVCRGCKKRDNCKAHQNPNHKQSCERRLDTVCSNQTIKWAAMECTNRDSQYHRSLLNTTSNGDKLSRITWSGCTDGERRDD